MINVCIHLYMYASTQKPVKSAVNISMFFQHLASRWVFICTFNILIQYFDEFSILSDLFLSWLCFWGHWSWMWKVWKPASRAVSTFSTCPVSQSAAQRFNPASKSRFNCSIFTGRLPACLQPPRPFGWDSRVLGGPTGRRRCSDEAW